MNAQLTIVMYHFVRDLKHSRFPGIKGLGISKFIGQLDYLGERYRFVTVEECLSSIMNGEDLPDNALLLTFDDGYIDHFTTVFPILDARSIQGAFFPPSRAITELQVLSVNKIHFLLANGSPPAIQESILRAIDNYSSEFSLEDISFYLEKNFQPNRFDPAEVNFIKRMLQRDLPKPLRDKLTDQLFREYVTSNERAFARELYMNEAQLKCMIRHGMYVGSHGYNHDWLNTLIERDQELDVLKSLDFLDNLGAPVKDWVISYPYGAYDSSLLSVLRKHHCAAGMTTSVRVADLSSDESLLLPRLDTNDLPQPEPSF